MTTAKPWGTLAADRLLRAVQATQPTDTTIAALRREAAFSGALARARAALEAAEEALAAHEERSVLEVRAGRCRAEVTRLEAELAAATAEVEAGGRP